jgi:preprotein translocase subunit SecA
LLEYDSVINKHRTAIYDRRHKILLEDTEILASETEEIIKYGEANGQNSIAQSIAEKKELLGDAEWNKILRRMLLQSIDNFWVDHLELMNYVRSSVNLRAYGQRDPLIEYKKEALFLYKNMTEGIYEQIARTIPNIGEGAFKQEEDKIKQEVKKIQQSTGKNNDSGKIGRTPGISEEKIGRNEKVVLVKGDDEIELKYKKAEEYLSDGWKLKK